MQPVSRTALAARLQLCVPRAPRLGRLRMSRAGGGAARGAHTTLRARCGGGTEPAEARKDGDVPGTEEAAGLVPKEEEEKELLEVLEEEAMGGGDEGRRPTDYDRRAHIFEESSRVFRDLKHRRDGDDDVKAAETTHDTNGGS